jgi:AraC-like DNA-binding protein
MNTKVFYEKCSDAVEECISSQSFAMFHTRTYKPSMDMHIHNCCEVFLNISGGNTFLINDRLYAMQPGSLLLINQFQTHKVATVEGEIFERYAFKFYPAWLAEHSTDETNLYAGFVDRMPIRNLSSAQCANLVRLFGAFESEYAFGADVRLMSIALEIACAVNECFLHSSVAEDEFSLSGFSLEQEILTYINQNLSMRLGVEELARRFRMSHTQLCRIFKNYTGTTINKYVTTCRVTNAKLLLERGSTVRETAEQVGFSDYAHFIRTFGAVVGMPPGQYARNK